MEGLVKIKKGYTLIELLIVVAIISILATVIIIAFLGARDKSRISKAKGELSSISTGIKMLADATGEYPGHFGIRTCTSTANPPVSNIKDSVVGLVSTDLNFKNWHGPYLEGIENDPWGNSYLFDPNYSCSSRGLGTNESEACNGASTITAILSPGPDGLASTQNDNIVSRICRKN